MKVYILFKNGKYIGVYKSYKAANEAINNQYFDMDFPPKYEIIEDYLQ